MRNPLTLIRNVMLVVCLVFVVAFAGDWASAMHSLGSVHLVGRFSPASIPADGKSTSTLTVRVSQAGHPRAGDILELVVLDSGYLVPLRAITDDGGTARFAYTSYAASPYQPLTNARVLIRDISIGRLVEVDKSVTVRIHLTQPKSTF